jgi:hypothetical protein
MLYRDLLNKDQSKKYELRENTDIGVYVKDLSSFVCKSVKEIEQVMFIGNQNRKIGYVCMYVCMYVCRCVKGKAISLQVLTGPEGSRRLKLPDFKTFGT